MAPNDNSKNQIYVGGDYDYQMKFPIGKIAADDSGIAGSVRNRFKSELSFYWLDESGELNEAPKAQLIMYPKYPEVRLSGILQGCKKAPSKTIASRTPNRILLFGTTLDRKTIAYAVEPYTKLSNEIHDKFPPDEKILFHDIPLVNDKTARKKKLIEKLKDIHNEDWLDSVRLDKDGETLPCNSPNCGGYTLEAMLGIIPNGKAEPDFLGWELKQYSVKSFDKPGKSHAITLMTPEPSIGMYHDSGAEAFIREYGYMDKNGKKDRMNFGGIYRCNSLTEITGLTIVLDGYDSKSGKILRPNGGIVLKNQHNEIIAGWPFTGLMKHWVRKHSNTAYIMSEVIKEPSRKYRFGNMVKLCENTEFSRFLKAFNEQAIYLDPALKLENMSTKPKTKRRNQFRIKLKDISQLYEKVTDIDILNQV
jgi:hypothetical protein